MPRWLIDLLISKGSFFFGGLITGVSLFVEERRRRAELAMYVLPKGLESAWIISRGKGYVFKTGNYGESLVRAQIQCSFTVNSCCTTALCYRYGHGNGMYHYCRCESPLLM